MKTFDPSATVEKITQFIDQIFNQHHKQTAVIAISGGIDSGLSLTLTTQALGAGNIIPLMLPYGEQVLTTGQDILNFNQISQAQWRVINIKPIVDAAAQAVQIDLNDKIRLGNLMARTRMMLIYDLAKKNNALVVGTENKSEKYLGYFTRFGDEASDLEPIIDLYKTQVRELAQFLDLPAHLITQKPTAGLWEGQTDEQELGFSYDEADRVLEQLFDENKAEDAVEGEPELVKKVVKRVEQMAFKHQVPYHL